MLVIDAVPNRFMHKGYWSCIQLSTANEKHVLCGQTQNKHVVSLPGEDEVDGMKLRMMKRRQVVMISVFRLISSSKMEEIIIIKNELLVVVK